MATGARASIAYGFETTFGAGATSYIKPFGRGVDITTNEFNNNLTRIYGVGSRVSQGFDIGRFETSLTVDFTLTNFDFLECFFGGITGDKYLTTGHPKSIGILISYPNGEGNATNTTYKGCIATDCTISVNNESRTTVSINFVCASVETSNGALVEQVPDTGDVYTYAEGHIVLGGNELSLVQSAEIQINQNAELLYGVGNRFAAGQSYKQLEMSINLVNVYAKSSEYLEKMYGGTSPSQTGATVISEIGINFESRNTDTDLLLTCKDCVVNTYSAPVTYEEEITEDMEILVQDLEIQVLTSNP